MACILLISPKEQQQREAAEKQLSDLQASKSSGGCHGACWQYEMDGHWHPFSPEGNDQMNQAYLAYISNLQNGCTASIFAGGVERFVDFQLMTQLHASTKRVRNIRIVAGVPQQWVSAPSALLTQTGSLGSRYKWVSDANLVDKITHILRSTGHAWDVSVPCSCLRGATVRSVHRIENFQLWHRYKARLAAMREDRARYNISVQPVVLDLDGREGTMSSSQSCLDCGEPLAGDVNEKILLHGTSWDNANSIVMHGFDHRICARGLYGDGAYFAGAACKSHQYTCGSHTGKACACLSERTLIIARVALGDAFFASTTRQGSRRPPNRMGTSGTYDSVVVNPGPISGHHNPIQVHQEFVIFDREQAYPAYVVQYGA